MESWEELDKEETFDVNSNDLNQTANQLISLCLEDFKFPLNLNEKINTKPTFSAPFIEKNHWHNEKIKNEELAKFLKRKQRYDTKKLFQIYEQLTRTTIKRDQNSKTEFSQKLYTAWEIQKQKILKEQILKNKEEKEKDKKGSKKGSKKDPKKGSPQPTKSNKDSNNNDSPKSESKPFGDTPGKEVKTEEGLINALKKSENFSSLEEAARLAINCLFHILKREIKDLKKLYDETNKFEMNLISKIFQTVYDILLNFIDYLNKEEKAILAQTLTTLSFEKQAKRIEFNFSKEIDFPKLYPQITQKINLTCETFELKYMEEEMIKRVNPVYIKHPDIKFDPDSWQYDLIQLINQNKSVIVTTPTSSGKSFISFYTITQVLKQIKEEEQKKKEKKKGSSKKNENESAMKSRIVFISPTKALATQMGISIYERYRDIPFGICTAEYRTNDEDCEILISTPEMFEILLLNPRNYEWSQNLKYCIFDEVHMAAKEILPTTHPSTASSPTSSSSESEDMNNNDIAGYDEEYILRLSSSYSRILSLVNCPFLALSASIKEPVSFLNWLKRTRVNSKNSEIHIIPKEKENINYKGEPIQRWTNIELKYFIPSLNNEAAKLLSIHPISILSEEYFSNLSNVSLTPKESLQLYEAILSYLPSEKKKEFENLSPENYFNFKKENRIESEEAKQYSNELLKYLSSLETSLIKLVISKLRNYQYSKLVQPYNVEENIYDLFSNMKEQKMLPSICFYLNQNGIEKCMKKLIQEMEKFDKQGPITMAEELDQEEEEEGSDEDKEEKPLFTSRRRTKKALEQQRVMQIVKTLKERSLRINKERFFINGDIFEYKFWLNRLLLEVKGWTSNNPFLIGLLYGIGAHHNGLPIEYRDFVEALFRSKLVNIVISTTTLQVGVDMPAKSVTFISSNNKFITPLKFRQMQGRAGRRGYDTMGYTVFFNVRPRTISEWISTPDSIFKFEDVLDIGTCLKMLILYNQKPESIETLKKLMVPSDNNPHSKLKLKPKLIFQFSLEVLYKLQLIDEGGKPIGLAGLVHHNGDMFPWNLVLSYLLLTESFTNSISEFEILVCLTHFFNSIHKLPATQASIPPLNQTLEVGFKNYITLVKNVKSRILEQFEDLLENDFIQEVLDEVLPTDFSVSQNLLVIKFYQLEGGNRGLKGCLEECSLIESEAYVKLSHFLSLLKKIKTSIIHLDPQEEELLAEFEKLIQQFEDLTLQKFEKVKKKLIIEDLKEKFEKLSKQFENLKEQQKDLETNKKFTAFQENFEKFKQKEIFQELKQKFQTLSDKYERMLNAITY